MTAGGALVAERQGPRPTAVPKAASRLAPCGVTLTGVLSKVPLLRPPSILAFCAWFLRFCFLELKHM